MDTTNVPDLQGVLEGVDVTPEIAAEVLYHLGYRHFGTRRPGSFYGLIIAALEVADYKQRHVLGATYPAYAAAVWAAKNVEDGTEQLRRIATGGAR